MNNISLDISTRIDARTVRIFRTVAAVAGNIGLEILVVGATARDMVMVHGFELAARRATRDIDLGVQARHWRDFETLRDGLIGSGNFSLTKAPQRLQYQDGTPLDIVPFGEIAGDDRSIRWPPDDNPVMTVLGFEEALADAFLVVLAHDPPLIVPVISPRGLVMLKLLAWRDRPNARKDAQDIGWTLREHINTSDFQNRLSNRHPDLLDEADFTLELAGARVLGREIGALASPDTSEVLCRILHAETDGQGGYRLVDDMGDRGQSRPFEENLALLRALLAGIEERF